MFLRFSVVGPDHENTGQPLGEFQAGYRAVRGSLLTPENETRTLELLAWFDKHLDTPRRFAKARKPSAQPKAISWFKPTALAHIAKARELVELLRPAGVEIVMSTTRTPGYVVYEDDFQIAAEPFRRG
jgi:hypothetical protein